MHLLQVCALQICNPFFKIVGDNSYSISLEQANIPAAYLSANMEWAEQQEIFRELTSSLCKYKLLYVTPEKVAK